MEPLHSFGDWIRRRRKALDLTQRELANQVGCALGTLKKIESDERRPSKQMAERIARCLAIPASEQAAFLQAARAAVTVDQLPAPVPESAMTSTIQRFLLRPKHNLPAQPTPLIGREHDVALVYSLIRDPDTHLVTLTGPGGVGKTRLAIQAASELVAHFADGVAFVPLASIADPNLVASQIAYAIGVQQRTDQPLAVILQNVLREQHLLLVLDNFEHVLAVATLVADLLAAAPKLTILITSREVIHLRGEKELTVSPLNVPSAGDAPSAVTLLQSAAVQLFVARVRDIRPSFVLTNSNASTVAAISMRLEGLPLTIELAARRIKLFEPDVLLERLSSRLALLTGGPRDLPMRQQTLRNTIAWSYDLLSSAEQRLYRQLSVFAGGWDLHTVTAVCADTDTQTNGIADIEALLAALTDKSLVRLSNGPGDAPRWMMLEIVREHALELLTSHDERTIMQRRHAMSFLQLAEQAEPALWEPQQVEWLRRLQIEHDNFRAALAWDADDHAARQCRARISLALAWFWLWRGYRHEGAAYLRAALVIEHEPTVLRAKLLHALGHHALDGNSILAPALFEENLTISRIHGDVKGEADALVSLVSYRTQTDRSDETDTIDIQKSLVIYQQIGDTIGMATAIRQLGILEEGGYRESEERCAESLELLVRAGHVRGQTSIWWTFGRLAHFANEPERAITMLQETIVLYRQLEDESGELWALLFLADVHFDTGAIATAAEYANEVVDLARRMNNRKALGFALQNLAKVELLHNHALERASLLFAQSVTLFQELDWEAAIWQGIVGHARVAAAAGNPSKAVRWCAAVEALGREKKLPPPDWPPEQYHSYQRTLATAHAALDPVAFQRAWDDGRALSLEDLIAETRESASYTAAA